MLPDGSKLIYTQPGEAFSLHIQIALIAGVIVAAPYIMLQVWMFIAPGLYSHEKKMAIPFVVLSTLGFSAARLTNHYVMFPFMMKFFGELQLGRPDVPAVARRRLLALHEVPDRDGPHLPDADHRHVPRER